MHHISEVRIQNFKSISSGTFPLSLFTPLVGYNNAGKTNIIKAIGWIIKKSSLPIEDFHIPNDPVVVEAEISGITGEVLDAVGGTHRARIEPLVVGGRIKIRRTQLSPNLPASSIRFEVFNNGGDPGGWVVNPTGIDAAISALFPEPIIIGAMENATEDVAKFGSGTTIGKLLKEIMEPVIQRHSSTVATALHGVGQRLSANAPDKDETLVALDERIQVELAKLFPGVSARTHIPVPEFADFIKSATIKIFEEGYENTAGRDASSFGHGAQRSIQIALVKCLADVRRLADGDAGRTTLLLIDEPELYLHPQAIEVVRVALSRLTGSGYQIVATTHSANMISRADAPNALLIRRNATDGTRCYPRLKDAVVTAIAEADHQSDVLFALSNATKILFSERVAIVEGKTERIILPAAFQDTFGVTPEEDRIGLVEIGGTHNIPGAMKVLKAMGLPCKAIVDLDFAFRVAPSANLLDAAHPDLLVCKDILAELNNQSQVSLDASGLPTKHNGAPAAAAFELLAEQPGAGVAIKRLHLELLTHGVWMWTSGAIEGHLGIAKTSAAQMAFMNGLSDSGYRATIKDYNSVVHAMTWLRS